MINENNIRTRALRLSKTNQPVDWITESNDPDSLQELNALRDKFAQDRENNLQSEEHIRDGQTLYLQELAEAHLLAQRYIGHQHLGNHNGHETVALAWLPDSGILCGKGVSGTLEASGVNVIAFPTQETAPSQHRLPEACVDAFMRCKRLVICDDIVDRGVHIKALLNALSEQLWERGISPDDLAGNITLITNRIGMDALQSERSSLIQTQKQLQANFPDITFDVSTYCHQGFPTQVAGLVRFMGKHTDDSIIAAADDFQSLAKDMHALLEAVSH